MEFNEHIGKTIDHILVRGNSIPGMIGSIKYQGDGVLVRGDLSLCFTDGTMLQINGEHDEGILLHSGGWGPGMGIKGGLGE